MSSTFQSVLFKDTCRTFFNLSIYVTLICQFTISVQLLCFENRTPIVYHSESRFVEYTVFNSLFTNCWNNEFNKEIINIDWVYPAPVMKGHCVTVSPVDFWTKPFNLSWRTILRIPLKKSTCNNFIWGFSFSSFSKTNWSLYAKLRTTLYGFIQTLLS